MFICRTEIYMKNIHGTMVVWLQNNEGFARWGPTEIRVEALLEAFRPVRDKERDKAQQDAANATLLNPPTEPTGRSSSSATDWPLNNAFKPPSTSTTPTSEPKSTSVQQW